MATSSMATINDLANETLVEIFDKFRLIQLMHSDEVCHKWGELKSFALSRRNELNICGNAEKIWHPLNPNSLAIVKLRDRLDRHTLYTKLIPPKMVDNIIKLMPNLTVIRTKQEGSFDELWKINRLLNNYSRQLIEVHIRFIGTFDAAMEDLEISKSGFRDMFLSLIATLNSLEKLDILVLFFKIPKKCGTSIEADLSVASRLKVLSMSIYGFTNDFSGLVERAYKTYAEKNESLQKLVSSNWFFHDTLLTFGSRVLTALREVRIRDWTDTEHIEAFKQLARQCPNLEVIEFGISNLSMAQVAEALLPCKALLWLKITLNFDKCKSSRVAFANDMPLDKLPVLSSVKALHLTITTASHRDLVQMDLEVIFPNIELVRLVHHLNRCQVCNFTIPQNIDERRRSVQTTLVRFYSFRVHECQRLTRLLFAKCRRLYKLKANIGLKEIPSSFKAEVIFIHETLNKATYSASGNFIDI